MGLWGTWARGASTCPVFGEKADIMERAWSLPGTSESNSAFLAVVTLGELVGLSKSDSASIKWD